MTAVSSTAPLTATARAASAHATGPAADAVADVISSLHAGLGAQTAGAVLWFASSRYTPEDLAGPLAEAFPDAQVIGCSTAGEFTQGAGSTGGLSAVALPVSLTGDAKAVLAELGDGNGLVDALAVLEEHVGGPLRELDPAAYYGLVLIDGMHGDEEQVSIVLGNAAPTLDVVGGSAGDDLAFESTWVAVGSQVSRHGTALLLARSDRPFRVVKTCSFTPIGHPLRVTKADTSTRTVLEFNDRPALEAYAEAVGVPASEVGSAQFMRHPLGLMLGDAPFIRSPQQVVDGGGMRFYCEILEGMEVEVMQGTDLVGETRVALDAVKADLGGEVSGAVLFNCILRRLELDEIDAHDAFRDVFAGIPSAGFHTYGETWMGHMNQTLTGLVFG